MTRMRFQTTNFISVLTETLLGVLTVGFNASLLTALLRYRRLWTMTSLLVINLGVAGVCAGVLWTTLSLLPHAGLPGSFHACLGVVCVIKCAYNVLVLSLVCVVVDRYCHVLHPVPYLRWATNSRIFGLLGGVWVLGILFGLVPFFWHFQPVKFSNCSWFFVLDRHFEVYFQFLGFLVPVLVTVTVLFVRVFRAFTLSNARVRRQWQVRPFPLACPSDTTRHRKEIFHFKRLSFIFVLLALTSLPLSIFQVISLWLFQDEETDYNIDIAVFLLNLSHVISIGSPLVYIYNRQEFQLIVASVWPQHRVSTEATSDISICRGHICSKSPTAAYTTHAMQAKGQSHTGPSGQNMLEMEQKAWNVSMDMSARLRLSGLEMEYAVDQNGLKPPEGSLQ